LFRSATHMSKKLGNPNIARYRNRNPRLGNGPCQKQLRMAFIAYNGPITTAQAAEWTNRRHYSNIKRALKGIGAVKLRRLGGMGRPLLWAPPLWL